MEPGIYPDIPNSDYHKGPGISKSGLDLVAKSPAHYYHAVNAANDNEPTAAQALGTAFHTLLLEPEVFKKEYVVELCKEDWPEAIFDKTGLLELASASGITLKKTATVADIKAALIEAAVQFDYWDDIKVRFAADNEGRTAISKQQYDQLMSMRDAVYAHPAARYLLSLPGKAEQSVYWTDPETGVLCRCRPDFWAMQARIIVDLKTCLDASPEGFSKSMYNWRYHVQDVMYREGCEAATGEEQSFVFLAVEKDACVVNHEAKGVAVYVLDDESRNAGLKEYRQSLATYAACSKSGQWPGYQDKVQIISIPAWGIKKSEIA